MSSPRQPLAAFPDHGEWSDHDAALLEAKDHLCRVARISAREIGRLVQAGIGTLSALADSTARG